MKEYIIEEGRLKENIKAEVNIESDLNELSLLQGIVDENISKIATIKARISGMYEVVKEDPTLTDEYKEKFNPKEVEPIKEEPIKEEENIKG